MTPVNTAKLTVRMCHHECPARKKVKHMFSGRNNSAELTFEKKGERPTNIDFPTSDEVTEQIIDIPDEKAEGEHYCARRVQLADIRFLLIGDPCTQLRPIQKIGDS